MVGLNRVLFCQHLSLYVIERVSTNLALCQYLTAVPLTEVLRIAHICSSRLQGFSMPEPFQQYYEGAVVSFSASTSPSLYVNLGSIETKYLGIMALATNRSSPGHLARGTAFPCAQSGPPNFTIELHLWNLVHNWFSTAMHTLAVSCKCPHSEAMNSAFAQNWRMRSDIEKPAIIIHALVGRCHIIRWSPLLVSVQPCVSVEQTHFVAEFN